MKTSLRVTVLRADCWTVLPCETPTLLAPKVTSVRLHSAPAMEDVRPERAHGFSSILRLWSHTTWGHEQSGAVSPGSDHIAKSSTDFRSARVAHQRSMSHSHPSVPRITLGLRRKLL